MNKKAYLTALPHGDSRNNLDEVQTAAHILVNQGFTVFHHALKPLGTGLDRECPTDPDGRVTFIRTSFDRMMWADALVVMSGWENSPQAKAEVAIARWRGIPVWEYPGLNELDLSLEKAAPEDILEEALRITRGDRQAQYGPPDQDFQRTAKIWSALKGIELTANDVAMFMIALKLSRQTHQRKRDNWVDIAGYARCGSLIADAAVEAPTTNN